MKFGLGLGFAAPAKQSGAAASPPYPPDYALRFDKASPDGVGNHTWAGPAGSTYRNSAGAMALSLANTPRHHWIGNKPCGYLMEAYSTNYCTNYNANPDAALTNVTASGTGTTGGILQIADPANLLQNAVDDLGSTINLAANVCTTGKVIKLDNSTGTAAAYLEFNGTAPNAATLMSLSAYAAGPTGSTLSYGATTASVAIPAPGVLSRVKVENFTPGDTTSKLRFTVPAGGIGYIVLNQLENENYASSVIITRGAQVQRVGDFMYDNAISTRPYFNQAQGGFMLDLAAANTFNMTMILFDFQAGNNSTAYNANNISTQVTNGVIKAYTAINSVRPNLAVGPNAGQSNTGIHSLDVAWDSFPVGATWNLANNSFISYAQAMDEQVHTTGNNTFSATLTSLEIGGKVNSSGNPFRGCIRSIKYWASQPTTLQIGQQMDFSNWAGVTNDGQSSLATAWAAGGVSGTDYGVGFNDGEKAFIATVKPYLPTKRIFLQHGAMKGSTETYGQADGSGSNAWYDLASGVDNVLLNRFVRMTTALVAGGGQILWHIRNGHETDLNSSRANLFAVVNHVMSKIWSLPSGQPGKTIGQIPTLFQRFARRSDTNANAGNGNDNPYQAVREFQNAFIAANPNVYMANERHNQPMSTDGIHLTDLGMAAYQPFDARLGLSLLGFSVPGPIQPIDIKSVTRSGATVTIVLALPTGCSDITNTNDIQGFRFFDQATVPAVDKYPTAASLTWQTLPAKIAVGQGTVTLQGTLSSVPTTVNNGGLFYSHYGCDYINFASAPNNYNPVNPAALVKGNDQYGQPLRARTMTLPYAA